MRSKDLRVLDRDPSSPVAQIRPPAWCLAQLRVVADGTLCGDDDRPGWSSTGIECIAEQDDLVLVVREQPERTWSLVWSEVTVEVSGSLAAGQLWVVRLRGMCEREPMPPWAAPSPNPPPYGLRIRHAVVSGYSRLVEELVHEQVEEQATG